MLAGLFETIYCWHGTLIGRQRREDSFDSGETKDTTGYAPWGLASPRPIPSPQVLEGHWTDGNEILTGPPISVVKPSLEPGQLHRWIVYAQCHVACVTRLIISGNFDSVLSKRVSYFFFSFFLLSLDLDTAFWRVNGFLWSYHVSWLCCTCMYVMRGDYLSWKKNKRIT